ncbi:MAG: DNA polymerase III subunit delta [Faecalibacterium sp.]
MAHDITKIKQLLKTDCPVFYFYASDRALAQRACFAARQLLQQEDTETTVLEGPTPEIEQIIMAAGTISFFSSRRIVELPDLSPKTYSDVDLDALCDTLKSAENAVFFITSTYPLEYGRMQLTKAAKKLIECCKKIGYVSEIAQPRADELHNILIEHAKEQGATLPKRVAAALVERCGKDLTLLENEVDKLSAFAQYQTITQEMVIALATQSLEADVFDMVRMITNKNTTNACKKLQTLLRLQHEPIAITAALIGSYTDLYRVKAGQASGHNYSTVFKEYGYKGNDYRLKKSLETANRYSLGQLERCIHILTETDQTLKSQPIQDSVVLEMTICSLSAVGGGR